MLADEYGTASNIKSRVNRQSVLSAITSTQQRLKLYTRVPTNGLVVYCGTVITDDGKEKQVTIDFEPFKPINTSLYLCDNKFHTEALSELLEDDSKFGFIVMDGNGSLFGTLAGNTREVIHKVQVRNARAGGRAPTYVRKIFMLPIYLPPLMSRLICLKSMDVVVSLRFVSPVFVRKSDIIMFVRLLNWLSNSSSPMTRSMLPV